MVGGASYGERMASWQDFCDQAPEPAGPAGARFFGDGGSQRALTGTPGSAPTVVK
jgi:hypothetical protein